MGQDFHPSRRVAWVKQRFLCLLVAALWLAFSNVPALAHKVMIFAWVDGDTVYTQGKLGDGRKAKNCTILVYDKEGNQLLEGKTDQKGSFLSRFQKEAI